MVYKSKIGIGTVFFIVLVLGMSSYFMIREGFWVGLLTNIMVIILFAYVFPQTYYIIVGEKLRVKCGIFVNNSFEINRTTKITETNNPISAPAASLDRLEILFDNNKSVIISSKQKNDFIAHLTNKNPKIIV